MYNFEFKNPTKLIFGKGQIAKIAKEIDSNAKIMITYGGGSIFKNGIYDQVKEALKGFNIVEFGGIEANPRYETLIKSVELAKREKIDFILAVGGGSTIDGTKFIAAAINYSGNDPWEFMLNPSLVPDIKCVPFGSVLTLPATGSEMNNGAVISKEATQEKLAFHHAGNFPQFSVLDPEACFSLPKRQITNGIVDTYIHVLEQYLTYPTNSLIQDRFCESILLTLKEIGPKLVKNSKDYDLCANFMLSATMGLNGFVSMGVPQDWATHMIGHELTALYGLDHAQTLAIVGPSLMAVMQEDKREKLLQYGERVWNITTGSDQERIDKTIEATKAFYESVGQKTKLSAYGFSGDKFLEVVDRFAKRGWKLGEKSNITPELVMEILQRAL